MSSPVIRSAWCPRCRELVSAFDKQGRCAFCDEQTGAGQQPAPATRYSNAGRPFLMDEETILRARELYAGGLSIRAVARELHPRTAYRSVDSLRVALKKQFSLRGWALRTQRATTAARNFRHGLAARDGNHAAYRAWIRGQRSRPCAGLRTQYPRRGQPCRLRAMKGSDYCFAHDPAREVQRTAQLAAMRERRAA